MRRLRWRERLPMGKRSNYERRERDFYPTPPEAVAPLLPHLKPGTLFVEPCAGDGALVRALEVAGHACIAATDIEPLASNIWRADALRDPLPDGPMFITNPPWDRSILHPLIVRLSEIAPTWLLFDADWMHTVQAAPFASRLRKVVSVGRVKWMPDSDSTGMDNCAWYLFDKPAGPGAELFLRAMPKIEGQAALFQ